MDVGPRQYMLQDCVVGSDQNLYTITGNDVVVVVLKDGKWKFVATLPN